MEDDTLWNLATPPLHPPTTPTPPPPPQNVEIVLLGGPRDGQRHKVDAGSHTIAFCETLLCGFWCEVYCTDGTTSEGAYVMRFDPFASDLYLARVTVVDRVRDWLASCGVMKPRTITLGEGGVIS